MKRMNYIFCLLAIALATSITGCKKDDEQPKEETVKAPYLKMKIDGKDWYSEELKDGGSDSPFFQVVKTEKGFSISVELAKTGQSFNWDIINALGNEGKNAFYDRFQLNVGWDEIPQVGKDYVYETKIKLSSYGTPLNGTTFGFWYIHGGEPVATFGVTTMGASDRGYNDSQILKLHFTEVKTTQDDYLVSGRFSGKMLNEDGSSITVDLEFKE